MFPLFEKYLKKKEKTRFQREVHSQKKKMYLFWLWDWNLYKKRRKIGLRILTIFKKGSLKSLFTGIYIFLICLWVFGSLFILYWPVFKVQKIEIIRKDDISDINIAYRAVEDYRGKLLFGIDTKQIAESLKLYQKNISDISIQKVLPHTLKIILGSYPWLFSTRLNGKEYMITENGVTVPKTGTGVLQNLLFTLPNQTINGIVEYKQVFDPKFIDKIRSLHKWVKDNLLSLPLWDMYYFPKERELHIITGKETKLIFDLNGNIEEQVRRLVIFNKENLEVKRPELLYIDLRIKNKVFFCTLENEFDCRKTLSYYYQY
jgi:hypothetical protein